MASNRAPLRRLLIYLKAGYDSAFSKGQIIPMPDDVESFADTGNMQARLRAYDWSNCVLGPLSTWPAPLKNAVTMMLDSTLPMWICWGPELLLLYNDGYARILAAKHPQALLRPYSQVWPEVWEYLNPVVRDALAGKSTFLKDTELLLLRNGQSEQAWFTYSISPLRNEQGSIAGIFGTAIETTEHVLAERERIAESERLRELFQQAPSFMAVVRGREHRFEIANPAYMRLLAHRPVLGKTFAEALPDAVEQGYLALLDQVYASGNPYNAHRAEYAMQAEPGGQSTVLFVNFVLQPIVGTDGNVSGIFIEGTDVTDLVLANHELDRVNREQALTVLQQQATEQRQAFQLAMADRIRPLSDAEEVVAVASELIGTHLGVVRVVYTEADDSGETLRIRRDWTNGVLPSMAGMVLHLDDFGPLIGEAVRTGNDLVIADVNTDERTAAYANAYAANGVRAVVAIPLMKAGRMRAILSLHDCQPHHWTEHEISLAQDMVDRTWSAVESAQAQNELRHERDQSQYIFDSMTEGFGLMDKDWTMLRVNAEGLRITQRTAHQVIGKNHWKVFPELEGTSLEESYRQVKETRQATLVETPYIFPDGSNGWVEIRVYPALNGGMAFFFRDISERKADQEKLQDADRRKDEFLAMLAHELRNPLAPISAAAELLQLVKLNEDRVRQTSQIIGRQVQHMTSLVDDLLDVSRVTRGLVELDKAVLDVSHIVADAIEQVTPIIRARHHRLAMHLTPEETLVQGDRKRLVQVLANLLNNAAKYTPEGGNIQVRTDMRGSHVIIEVGDDGIGMAPELVARAFDLFAQAERSSDRSSGGLGLGLSLVRNLVELHHGTVTCESAGLGRGSKFTICLPHLVEHDAHRNAQTDSKEQQKQVQSLRILVVDDNVDAASMLAMLLEASGHEVLVEHSARRALELSRNEAPQVCLLDIGLPDMDGNELAQQLRAQPETARAVLIAVTGYGQEKDREQTLAAGFDHHLVKPVDTKKLNSLLAKISRV